MMPDSKARLWNPERSGTLIVSDPRCGTHFLQSIVKDAVADHRACQTNGEIDLDSATGDLGLLTARLEQMAKSPDYQVGIVNSLSAKTEILARPSMLSRWHVIRLTRRDKVSWMRSWCLFFLSAGSEVNVKTDRSHVIMHHATTEDIYRSNLDSHGPIRLHSDLIKDLSANLCLHVLCDLIPADEEIDYDDLPGLQSEHTWWKGNQYPDISMHDWFENYHEIEPLLLAWTRVSRAGRFRESSG